MLLKKMLSVLLDMLCFVDCYFCEGHGHDDSQGLKITVFNCVQKNCLVRTLQDCRNCVDPQLERIQTVKVNKVLLGGLFFCCHEKIM